MHRRVCKEADQKNGRTVQFIDTLPLSVESSPLPCSEKLGMSPVSVLPSLVAPWNTFQWETQESKCRGNKLCFLVPFAYSQAPAYRVQCAAFYPKHTPGRAGL